mgnify:CR=1 FL=1
MIAVDLISWFLIIFGSSFCVIAAIGVLRLPDYFSRIHAVGILDSVGAGALILGLMLQAGLTLVTIKLLMILVIIVITGPTATYALARAALDGGLKAELDEEDGSSSS